MFLYLLLWGSGCVSSIFGMGPRFVSISPHLNNICLFVRLVFVLFICSIGIMFLW